MSKNRRKRDDGCPIEGVRFDYVTNGDDTKGWLHSHGMADLGLPELEIRDVPSYFVGAGVELLRTVCHYLKKPGAKVRAGEAMVTGPNTAFRFVLATPIPGQEDHYQEERWRIEDIALRCQYHNGPEQAG
jgi:hypothetical protein